MKRYFAEYKTDYSKYIFSYAVYCIKEQKNEVETIYEQGFLPYTGNYTLENDHFYLCRSLRIKLSDFEDTSENRRISRKIEPLAIKISLKTKEEFDVKDENFVRFCSQYAEERYTGGEMGNERLDYVISREVLTHFFVFESNEKILGYVFAAQQGKMLHYWFSFYDTDYMNVSLGKFMMWRVIRWAKENDLDYVYLGTCYKEKALYKVRDHKGCEFFDGKIWNNNTEKLKEICKMDSVE